MATQYKVGDHVTYQAIGAGTVQASPEALSRIASASMLTNYCPQNSSSTGTITKIMTASGPAGSTGNTVEASPEDPRYVIKNDNTAKETAYKLANIKGKI